MELHRERIHQLKSVPIGCDWFKVVIEMLKHRPIQHFLDIVYNPQVFLIKFQIEIMYRKYKNLFQQLVVSLCQVHQQN